MNAPTVSSPTALAHDPALPAHMQAMVIEEYGPPEALAQQTRPLPEVAEDGVLIRMNAASVCGDEWHLMQGLPLLARMETGLRRPKRQILGLDVAGEVVAVGPEVTRFKVGDAVFGWCEGAFADYVAAPEDALALKPDALSFEQAAGVPISGLTALHAVRNRGEVKPGQKVLINGASGGVGQFAVQIAKALGGEVTGVASTRNLQLIQDLGADHVIDYTTTDCMQSGPYDVIIDLAQSHSLAECREALTKTGTLVLVGSAAAPSLTGRHRWFKGTDRWFKAVFLSLFSRQKLRPMASVTARNQAALQTLVGFIEAGDLTAYVGKALALNEAADAIRFTQSGQASGKTVVTA